MYDDLVAYLDLDLQLNITPKKGNHPKGYYVIPNKIAREFIESKQGTPNWNNYKNFKQDGVPRDLTKYFSYK